MAGGGGAPSETETKIKDTLHIDQYKHIHACNLDKVHCIKNNKYLLFVCIYFDFLLSLSLSTNEDIWIDMQSYNNENNKKLYLPSFLKQLQQHIFQNK